LIYALKKFSIQITMLINQNFDISKT